jgi:hypothetical protein
LESSHILVTRLSELLCEILLADAVDIDDLSHGLRDTLGMVVSGNIDWTIGGLLLSKAFDSTVEMRRLPLLSGRELEAGVRCNVTFAKRPDTWRPRFPSKGYWRGIQSGCMT